MKLIFLDIDGVLNDMHREHWSLKSGYQPEITPKCVQAFNRIVTATMARIVLSSSWRYHVHNGHMSLHGFQTLLKSHGVTGHLIGVTREDEGDDEPRWRQIADWLKWRRRTGVGMIESYIILDDDPDAFGGRPGIQTDARYGLTEEQADMAILMLSDDQQLVACGLEEPQLLTDCQL